jgi:fluoride ion exporter CrcB/FEX
MNFGSVPDNTQAVSWLIVGFFSAWGGLVRYLMDIRPAGQRWCWMAAISQVTISCFTGFLGGFYGYEQHNSVLMTLVLAGICSTLGGSLLRWLWLRILQTPEVKS